MQQTWGRKKRPVYTVAVDSKVFCHIRKKPVCCSNKHGGPDFMTEFLNGDYVIESVYF